MEMPKPSGIPRRVAQKQLDRELGFGKHVTTEGRMMNTDGSFNIRRQRIGLLDNAYYHLVTMPWWLFMLTVTGAYIVLNAIFAILYVMVGIENVQGIEQRGLSSDFMEAFFFSAQTLTTVGYGRVSPVGLAANIISTLESLAGLMSFGLISGLLYGRFARPKAKIVFSEHMLVAPYREGRALMFRLVNARRSELLETEIQAIFTINQEDEDGRMVRRFYPLKLELDKISFFTMSWTIVHALNLDSPLWEFNKEDLFNGNMEIMILAKGTDEANQQIVHARHSYIAQDVVWNARFKPIIMRDRRGMPVVLTRAVDDYELLEEKGSDNLEEMRTTASDKAVKE